MASPYNGGGGGGEIKQKKGGGTYVYKFDTSSTTTTGSNQKPQDQNKKHYYFSPGISWGLRRSKTVREVVVNKNKPPEGGGGDDKEIVVEARRSSVCSGGARGGGGGGQHRKSVSHMEVNAAAVAAFLQVKVLVTDMPGFMQAHAFRCARSTYDTLDKFSSKHMAYNIKKEFDKVYGLAWHCIVGSSFGSFVTHSTGCFLYFSMEKLYILLFKTKVQRTPHES